MLKLCVGFMNAINGQRRPEEGIQEAWMVRGEEAAYEPNADSHGSESFGRNISSPKHQQIGSHRNNTPRENATVALLNRGENSGKISERLKLIEESFLSYVRSNQERLEAQLDQSRTLEQNFLAAIRELESEISSLVPEQEDQLNEDLSLESIQEISHKQ
jgi:DNA-binding NarL/FixJ family response regulator